MGTVRPYWRGIRRWFGVLISQPLVHCINHCESFTRTVVIFCGQEGSGSSSVEALEPRRCSTARLHIPPTHRLPEDRPTQALYFNSTNQKLISQFRSTTRVTRLWVKSAFWWASSTSLRLFSHPRGSQDVPIGGAWHHTRTHLWMRDKQITGFAM